MSSKSLELGTTVAGYRVERKEPLPHIDGTYYELTHEKTGARHIHITSGDDNNFFAVVFPTVPKDSTGVAHILEHVVLAGSERFPVHDMFSSMQSRSLQTFMNASTDFDATYYYFSTRNVKDFSNLLEVYLDAVFFPRNEELAFKQEGHRLEFEKIDDPSTPLMFKGVVFNEMKGRAGTPAFVLIENVGKALYPDLTYANMSGGDPAEIPNLTWENLRKFHATHYHPTNSYFFTYGNIPIQDTLQKIQDLALSRFDRIETDTAIGDTKRFEKPREFRAAFPLAKEDDPAKKAHVQVAWSTTHMGNSFEVFALNVLEHVLLAHAASPLHKALIDSGLGDTLTDFYGSFDWYREGLFCAGLKGVDPEDAAKIEKIILDTLEQLVSEGVDPAEIDAAVHRLEIESREVSNVPSPYPAKLFGRINRPYVYGGDPYKSLQFDDHFARLEKERASGRFFENLIRTYLLDNPHRVRIVLSPDQKLTETEARAERARLDDIRSRLSSDQVKKIVDESLALEKVQEEKQDLSVLPTLELTDIPMEFEDVAHSIEQIGGARVGFFPQPTNGITYVDIRASFSGLPDRLKDRLPLFAYSLTKSGAGAHDYLAMASRINSYTGGVGAGASTRPLAADGGFLESFVLTGKALVRNHEPFMAILKDLLSAAAFEPKRLKDLISEYRANKESLIALAGHQYALMLARSKVSQSSAMTERLNGLSQLALLKELSNRSESELGEVIEDLNAIRDHLFRNAGLDVCVTAEEKHFPEIRKLLDDTLQPLPSTSAAAADGKSAGSVVKHQARTLAVPVAFNAKVYKTVGYGHLDAPSLMVLARLIDSKFLHREVREKGGAYGAFGLSDREEGVFAMASYRDPQIARTFEAFEGAVRFALEAEIEEVDLKEAILEACRDVDPLLSPDTKGRTRFFGDIAGYTLDLKAKFKQRLLEVTREDLKRVAQAHLEGKDAALAVIGGGDQVEEANSQMGGIFEVASI